MSAVCAMMCDQPQITARNAAKRARYNRDRTAVKVAVDLSAAQSMDLLAARRSL